MSIREDALLLNKVMMQDASDKAEKIISKYGRSAEDIEKIGNKTALKLKAQSDDPEFNHKLRIGASRMISAAELKTRFEIENYKKKLLFDILSAVEQKLMAIRGSGEYTRILKNLALDGINHLGGDNFIIILRAEDREIFNPGIALEIERITGKKVETGEPDPSISAGLIVKKKNAPLIYDNSLKGFMERQNAICYQMANNMLWSQII